MAYEVSTEEYSGPLQLLLELIEKDQLPITDVSLAKVTEDYVSYVEKYSVPPEELADFLVIATKLLLIKSRAILPDEEQEQEETTNLAAQLRLYKYFVEAAELLEERFENAQGSFAREKAMVLEAEEFSPPEGFSSQLLQEAFARLMKHLEPFLKLQQTAIERVVSVQERMKEIRQTILNRSRFTFKNMIGNGKSKVEVVVSFLALLELVKQRVVHVVQSETFNDIEVKRAD